MLDFFKSFDMNKFYDFVGSICLWMLTYFMPVYPVMLSVGFFIVCDLITGVLAAKKRGEAFRSKKMRNTVYKFICYGIAIMVARVIEQQFLPDFPGMKLIAGFLSYIELKSLNENIEDITGNNIFKTLLTKFNPD